MAGTSDIQIWFSIAEKFADVRPQFCRALTNFQVIVKKSEQETTQPISESLTKSNVSDIRQRRVLIVNPFYKLTMDVTVATATEPFLKSLPQTFTNRRVKSRFRSLYDNNAPPTRSFKSRVLCRYRNFTVAIIISFIYIHTKVVTVILFSINDLDGDSKSYTFE